MKKIIVLLFVLSMLQGCFKTIVTNGIKEPVDFEFTKWHHNVALSLVEISDPVHMKKVCPKGWKAVKTHQSFLNGLAASIVFGGYIWTPQTVSIACK